MKKLDYYIIAILALTIVFTGIMIWMFWVRGYIPDTLVTSWFAYIVGELVCCALIKTVGERQANRKDTLEDRKYFDDKEEKMKNERN